MRAFDVRLIALPPKAQALFVKLQLAIMGMLLNMVACATKLSYKKLFVNTDHVVYVQTKLVFYKNSALLQDKGVDNFSKQGSLDLFFKKKSWVECFISIQN